MDESSDDGPVAERIEQAMPPVPEVDKEAADNDEFDMSLDEQRLLSDALEAWVRTLYDRGFTPNELGVIFSGFKHRMNASRFRPYEFQRIELQLRLRETAEQWRDEQDEAVPERVLAEAFESFGRMYRDNARRELYEATNSTDEGGEHADG